MGSSESASKAAQRKRGTTLVDEVHAAVREAIMAGELASGDRLSSALLSEGSGSVWAWCAKR